MRKMLIIGAAIIAPNLLILAQADAVPFTVDGSTLTVSGGQVGIATASPATTLEVNGIATFDSNTVTKGTVTIQGNAFSVGGSSFIVNGGTVTIQAPYFTIGGSTLTVWNGSVLVGNLQTPTNPPQVKLQVSQGSGGSNTAPTSISLANAYLHLGGAEYNNGSYRIIGFGQVGQGIVYPPAYLGYLETNDAGQGLGALVFGTRNTGSDVLPSERMRIDPVGNVGIATVNPAYTLDVSSYAHATSWLTSSDIRFKENIKPLENVLDKLSRIRGVSFDWNDRYKKMGRATGGKQIGVIAQEVEKEFPELVMRWSAPDHPVSAEPLDLPKEKRHDRHPKEQTAWVRDYRSMDYNRFTAVLLEAIKEQQKQIEDMTVRIKALESTSKAK